MWHFDTYATFVKFNQITEDQIGEVQRTAIMMKDWNHGQVLEIDGSIFLIGKLEILLFGRQKLGTDFVILDQVKLLSHKSHFYE